jgi:Ca-activated chloride channel homolog
MALLLLVDVSGSVDDKEYAIQKEGIVYALSEQSVHRAIYNQRGICIAYMEFSDGNAVVVPWQLVETPADAIGFAALVASSSRSSRGSTNVFGGIAGALAYLADSPCRGEHVIDVSGDGENNVGGEMPQVPGNVRINALPILGEEPNLDDWYRNTVVRDGFVLVAEGFDDFARALRQKLAQEIAGR